MKSPARELRNGAGGSVLMEYLVLLVFVGAVLSVASNRLFYGYAADDNEGRRLGPVGRQIQGFYQRTMGGLSIPVP